MIRFNLLGAAAILAFGIWQVGKMIRRQLQATESLQSSRLSNGSDDAAEHDGAVDAGRQQLALERIQLQVIAVAVVAFGGSALAIVLGLSRSWLIPTLIVVEVILLCVYGIAEVKKVIVHAQAVGVSVSAKPADHGVVKGSGVPQADDRPQASSTDD